MKQLRILATLAVSAAASLQATTAMAVPLTTLYTFTGNADGAYPENVIYYAGNLYGTTVRGGIGGITGLGAVYKINPVTGAIAVLHDFNGTDGGYAGGLIQYGGSLYGVTGGEALYNHGTLYKMDPASGVQTIIHTFGAEPDGWNPIGAPLYHLGWLYGVTQYGGTYGQGTVYKINASTGVETILHSFDYAEGKNPVAGLTYYKGYLYGVASSGGSTDNGAVFKINPNSGAYTKLYEFTGGSDGGYPCTRLVLAGGAFYATSLSGGSAYAGTIYKIDPAPGAKTMVYAFQGGTDGGGGFTPLTYYSGKLYGTVGAGGDYNGGVFVFDPATGAKTTLYTFTGGLDGSDPASALVYHAGKFYGATDNVYQMSPVGYGTVFSLPIP